MRETLLIYLNGKNLYVSSPCGGKGLCGKCLVKISGGKKEGIFKACRIYTDELDEYSEITIMCENDFYALEDAAGSKRKPYIGGKAAACIDIGTTTIAVCLADMATGSVIDSVSMVNRQRLYGADVISRIEASKTNLRELNEFVTEDISTAISKLMKMNGVSKIETVGVTGNMCMIGLFLNISCESMGISPFLADKTLLCYGEYDSERIFKKNYGKIKILPGISAFVGADALSGIMYLKIDKSSKKVLYIDIGTNTEIAIFSDGKAYMTSAAAGPAFEGGNISCGAGSVYGAVSEVKYKDGGFSVTTIGGGEPVGICGSGIVDCISELIKHGFVDETGLLQDEYFETGVKICENVTILQSDIRNVQLAKAAVRAGVEYVAHEAGVGVEEPDETYISGGFGSFINYENAVNIGLLPKFQKSVVKKVGNAALLGAVKLAATDDFEKRAYALIERSKTINLGQSEFFAEKFIEFMSFPR